MKTNETHRTNQCALSHAKLRPLLFDMASKKYWALGHPVGNCWNAGKSLK
jgi:hypothetical protein